MNPLIPVGPKLYQHPECAASTTKDGSRAARCLGQLSPRMTKCARFDAIWRRTLNPPVRPRGSKRGSTGRQIQDVRCRKPQTATEQRALGSNFPRAMDGAQKRSPSHASHTQFARTAGSRSGELCPRGAHKKRRYYCEAQRGRDLTLSPGWSRAGVQRCAYVHT